MSQSASASSSTDDDDVVVGIGHSNSPFLLIAVGVCGVKTVFANAVERSNALMLRSPFRGACVDAVNAGSSDARKKLDVEL